MTSLLEKIFHIKAQGSSIRTETIAGVTTFMTMAYIIFVNPAMISRTGMDFGAALAATCLSAAIATIVMGLYANYPIALAPGMGENAFFTFTVCVTMGISWQTALGCVFIEGILFIILTVTRMRQMLIDAIPLSLRYGTAAGIGLLITLIGLKAAGIVVANQATISGLGDVVSPGPLLALSGLVITGWLLGKKVNGAILWGILITMALGILFGIIKFQGVMSMPPSLAPTFLKMDLIGAMKLGLLSVIFIFLFMDIFDTVGTLAGVAEIGGFMRQGKLPRVGQAMMSDAVGTCIGAACGTPTVTSYIESASGIAAGGRTGLANVVTGLLFFAALFFSPLIKMVGAGYKTAGGLELNPITAPALIIVGCMMLKPLTRINWDDYSEIIPAFLVLMIMPLTFSIATGLAFGFISYAALKLLAGKGKNVSWLVYLFSVIFVLRFLYLKAL
ncbi:MAG: NCS2 family permease [Candidatus Omnitrophica bacterium]|nr:NCS2 family permease [Candidatus Omnitrophota bacterium]